MNCRCGGRGWYTVDDGNGCVAREPCDTCDAFDNRATPTNRPTE